MTLTLGRLNGNRYEEHLLTIPLLLNFLKDIESRKEKSEVAKNKEKSSFCSTDILSKMFGAAYQEGQGHREGGRHLMVNAFPQDGEGHLPS